ncbi:hypothetical protein V6N11_067807 [Hibiscus sabdariffa]|uniref:Uncharacterized protein n=1 Tax=Hibiscus sabdariffa TaxID=183260 RepID=A0ABR2SRV1_9ROSI
MVGGSRFATLQDLRENNEYVYGHWENTMSPNHVGSAHTEKKVMNRDKNNEQAKESHSKENHGSRLHKGLGPRSSSRTTLSKWFPSTINLVDDEAIRIQHDLEFDYDVMDDDDSREANDGARNGVDSLMQVDDILLNNAGGRDFSS